VRRFRSVTRSEFDAERAVCVMPGPRNGGTPPSTLFEPARRWSTASYWHFGDATQSTRGFSQKSFRFVVKVLFGSTSISKFFPVDDTAQWGEVRHEAPELEHAEGIVASHMLV
jgi:hypothetical protein